MSNWFYVWLGWGVTAGTLTAYALWVILRGRALSRRVAPQDRRWM
jgi:heme exporter protein CcmD